MAEKPAKTGDEELLAVAPDDEVLGELLALQGELVFQVDCRFPVSPLISSNPHSSALQLPAASRHTPVLSRDVPASALVLYGFKEKADAASWLLFAAGSTESRSHREAPAGRACVPPSATNRCREEGRGRSRDGCLC